MNLFQGEITDWFVCALYVSCKKYSNNPNPICLTKILRHAETRLEFYINFFYINFNLIYTFSFYQSCPIF